MRTSVMTVIAAFLLDIVSVTAAMAETNCLSSVDAIRAEWRALSHSSFLKPSQTIRTGDGRKLSGSQLNYAHVLISRADNACGVGQVEQAWGYVDEANKLLHPAPGSPGLMLAKPAGN
jgi:hypothetical protein